MKSLGCEKIKFVVGSDTYVRIVDPKYYESRQHLERLLQFWKDSGVSFVVCPRGEILTNPSGSDSDDGLSLWLKKSEFWMDISSTEIRKRKS